MNVFKYNTLYEEIRSSIYEEMKLFNHNYYEIIQSKIYLMKNVIHYIMKRKGKQIRPILIFLIAKMLGKITDKTYKIAYLIELIHTATLIHDDIVDNSHIRRGNLSINALWKNKIAVLVGDYLFSKSMLITNSNIDVFKIVLKTIEQMSEGELLEIEQYKNILNITEKSYEEIILYKTASLISASCEGGASSIGANKHICSVFRKFGEFFGLAFQIKDDLFDYENYNVGKPIGIDIRDNKITLPLIYTLQRCDYNIKNWIIDSIKNHKDDKNRIQEIIKIVHKHGGIDYTRNKMKKLLNKSLNLLKNFPENYYKKSLKLIVDYIICRKI
jgi:octaprenyl-diphosphate synthase